MRARLIASTLALAICAGPASAQDPLAAIDWLRDGLSLPSGIAEAPVTDTAAPADIDVTAIDRPSPDAVGLLPSGVTGLPDDLWGRSAASDLARRLAGLGPGLLPEMRRLLFRVLVSELRPPADSGPEGLLFLARVDTLIAFGALDPAKALLERAGTETPESFARLFDAALLTGTENEACDTLRRRPELSSDYAARVFCLARGGDWDAAALTLEVARALDFIPIFEDALLTRFLDPVLFEGVPPLVPPESPSPLVFRMSDALGDPIPTARLPLAFAQSDLRESRGWKAQIEAAERLARSGAVPANRLLGLYTQRQAAASGGVWDRVVAVQQLEAALDSRDLSRVAPALIDAWHTMAGIGLEPVLAELFAPRLAGLNLPPEASALAFRMTLLTDDFADPTRSGGSEADRFLAALAQGRPGDVAAPNPTAGAIADAFRATSAPARLDGLIEESRLGEALLRAMTLIENGARGDVDELTDALAFLRATGFETSARRVALEILILDPRG